MKQYKQITKASTWQTSCRGLIQATAISIFSLTLFACNGSGGTGSTPSSQSQAKLVSSKANHDVYLGLANGTVYKNDQLVPGTAPTMVSDGVIPQMMVVESGVIYVPDGFGGGVWVESGQSWQLVGGMSPAGENGQVFYAAVSGNSVYAAVRTYDAVTGAEASNVWVENGHGWQVVGGVIPTGEKGHVISMAASGDKVYVAGCVRDAATKGCTSYVWVENGNGWQVVDGVIPTGENGDISSMAVGNNKIYVAGCVRDAVTKSCTSYVWVESGQGWQVVGGASPAKYIDHIAVSDGKVYAQVRHDVLNNSDLHGIHIVVESGHGWYSPINTALDGSAIKSIAINNQGTIYAGVENGKVFSKNTTSNNWHAAGESVPFSQGHLISVTVSGNNAYAVGDVWDKVTGSYTSYVRVESGHGWQVIGGAIPTGEYGSINSMAVSGDNVYAIGNDYDATGTICGYVWVESGHGWQMVGEPIHSSIAHYSVFVNSITINNGRAYVAGVGDKGVSLGVEDSAGYVWVQSNHGWKVVGGTSPTGEGGSIDSVTVNNDNVYAAGYMQDSVTRTETSYVWVENGHGWHKVGNSSPDGSKINSITVIDGNVYAATRLGNVWMSEHGKPWVNLHYGVLGVAINSMAVSGSN